MSWATSSAPFGRPCFRLDCDCSFRRRGLGCLSLCPHALLLSSRCDLTRGFLGCFAPRPLVNGSSVSRRLLGRLPPKPLFRRGDLTRRLLGCFPPRPLFNGNSLPCRLLGHLPSKLLFNGRGLLGQLLDGRRNPPLNLLIRPPPRLLFNLRDLTGGLLGSDHPRLLFNGRGLLGQLLDSRRNPPLDLLIRPPPRLLFNLRDLTRGLLGCFPPRLLLGDNNLPGRLVGRLAPRPLFSRCDLPRGLLGCFPPRLLLGERSLPGRLLGQLPANLLARLFDRHGNPAPNLLICPQPRPLLCFCDLTRGRLARFPPSPLLGVGNQPGDLLCGLVRHCLRRRDRLRHRFFAGLPALRRGHGVQRCPLCRRSPRLLANVELPLAFFDRFAPGRFLLGVHVALDQPLPVLGQRLGGLILSPRPRGHSREATYGVCPGATTPQGIPQDLRPESGPPRGSSASPRVGPMPYWLLWTRLCSTLTMSGTPRSRSAASGSSDSGG